MTTKTLLAPLFAFALLGAACSDDPAPGGGTGGTPSGTGGNRTGGTTGSGGSATGGTTGSGGSATGGTSGTGGTTTTDGGVETGSETGAETGAETGSETGGDAPSGEVAAGVDPKASFFITSRTGDGNLGGLTGADTICQNLASAVGLGGKVWKAYLSADTPATNAKDRIGTGPWYNIKGALIAEDLTKLHMTMGAEGRTPMNMLSGETGLTEKQETVKFTNPGNQHDILTGSNADGTLAANKTCMNWMSTGQGVARVGHFNQAGGGEQTDSWNSAHDSQGCSAQQLVGTGGAGRFYCFAVTP